MGVGVEEEEEKEACPRSCDASGRTSFCLLNGKYFPKKNGLDSFVERFR